MEVATLINGTTPHLTRATANATSQRNGADTTDATTITADDFLTLLVTQMKNQDPTQPSDPSQYLQQLVGVNSLEQLINVNKQLTSLGGSTTGSSLSQTTPA
jgi:flagellar basal-body rod modification protein FlgD